MNDFQKQELIDRHFGYQTGGAMVKTSLVRMYTQLPGFNTDVAGLYAFLRSWRNSKEDSDMFHAVWHSKDYLYIQSGLGRKAFASRLEVLERYNLVTVKKSTIIPNKDVIYVHDPLTRDEFAKAHPKVVEEFIQKAAGIEARNLEYRLSELLKIEQKAEKEADS
jgi:hypothetical protein